MLKAAGIMFIVGQTALFLRRGNGSAMPNMWCVPGGKMEEGETLEQAAIRETWEEAGVRVEPDMLRPWTRAVALAGVPVLDTAIVGDIPAEQEDVDFCTYVVRLKEQFTPTLNLEEHDGYAWAPIAAPPLPLHPGCQVALDRFTMDELGVARAMADGRLTSPQRYENMWLFNIRITGTGASYRHARKEYVWRDPSIYLNDEFLARCNGLPVIWEHPESNILNSEEYADRNVGTVFLPYLRPDRPGDVWAIAKIYDDGAAQGMIDEVLSTSPAVRLPPENMDSKMTMESGEVVLIEEKPILLDHIAICQNGVWDKGGDPTGVESITAIADAVPLVYADAQEVSHNGIDGLDFLRAHTALLLVNAQIRATSNKRSGNHARVEA